MIRFNARFINRIDYTGDITFVIDFDKTITSKESESTFGVFAFALPERYNQLKRKLDLINNANEYWYFRLILLQKFLNDKHIFEKIIATFNFELRENVIETINLLQSKGHNIIINSSGIGNIIELILEKQGCNMKKIKIYSNFYEWKKNKWILKNTDCISPYNKKNKQYIAEIKKDAKYILIGDTIEDITMLPENYNILCKIAFLDNEIEKYKDIFLEKFDIIAIDNESFSHPFKVLKLL